MEPIKKLRARRGVVKGHLTRMATALSAEKIVSLNVFELETKLGVLENHLANFNVIQSQLEEMDETEGMERDAFEDSYCEVKARLLASISEHGRQQSNSVDQSTCLETTSHSNDLPKHKLKSFSGDPAEWLEWWNMFNMMVHEKIADPRDKFHRLRSMLEGNAQESIRSLEATAENYPKALNILKGQYDNKRYLYRIHVSKIIDLQNIPFASVEHLIRVNNNINANMRALLSLSSKEQIADGLLLAFVTSKLDSSTSALWEEHATSLGEKNQQGTEGGENTYLPTWEDFSEFVQKRCRTLELIEFNNKKQPTSKQQHKPNRVQCRVNSFPVTQATKCPFCKQECKSAFKCTVFLAKSPQERFNLVKALNLCINCLKAGHTCRDCNSSGCRTCHRNHHTLLHKDYSNSARSTPAAVTSVSQLHSFVTHDSSSSPEHIAMQSISKSVSEVPKSQVILSTALIEVKSSNNSFITCRALLDSGSQLNFITNRLAQLLGLQRVLPNTAIVGIGSSHINTSYKSQIFIKSRVSDFTTSLEAYILPSITGNIPVNRFDISHLDLPSNLQLADPSFNQPQRIDILIGASIFYSLLSVGQIRLKQSAAVLQKTLFGWVVSGQVQSKGNAYCLTAADRTQFEEDAELNQLVTRFWELETFIQQQHPMTVEEEKCEKHFVKTHHREVDGRFVVRLPFRKDPTAIGESYDIALKRYISLERKLLKNVKLRNDYTNFITEYLSLNHMEEISKTQLRTPNFFLPHHPVLKSESTTTKLRVVFDESCKGSRQHSLNDVLMVGPKIQDDVFEILLRFRLHVYAITADIVKMYRQVLVDKRDRDMQCILWRNQSDQPVKMYRLRTVTYGTSSASFLAIRSMRQLAINESNNYPIGAHHVLHNFYVDNLMAGANSIQELVKIKEEVKSLLLKGHLPLRKWCSNGDEVLADLGPSEVETLLRINDGDVVRVLGLFWNPSADNFSFTCLNKVMQHTSITKRTVLSQVASLFDPLGFINPVVVSGKLFLRHLWTKGINWDESLPQDLDYQWREFYHQLQDLQALKIPRLSVTLGSRIQMHGFCDASMRAYGACIYFRCVSSNGDVQTRLICAKSRVAPILCESLARLELCGALLLAELAQRVKASVNINLESTFYWSDSTITLSWIKSIANQWSIFVSNRVSKIQQLTLKDSWNHVPSQQNPADSISRGCLPEELLKNTIWFEGPTFLKLEATQWPHLTLPSTAECPERKRLTFSFVSTKAVDICDLTIRCKFSNSYFRLVIVFCYIRRWLKKKWDQKGRITTAEISSAELSIVRNIQMVHFRKEMDILASGQYLKDSPLTRLNIFLDEGNILRVGGRLRHSALPYNSRHQILLPSSHPFLNSLVMHYHLQYLHAGNLAVLNILRRRYWIVNGLRTVSSILIKCIVCYRFRPILASQIMGDLPAERTSPTKPFTITGIDYCGPVYITQRIRGRQPVKAYICVFVCFVVKAVHLELVPDMSTESFLSALRRFLSRRGNCSKIYSDNGSNFIGAKNELEKICRSVLTSMNSDVVQQFCQKSGISWAFIPPRAPHFGGLWEAAVKVAKTHIQKVIAGAGNCAFTYDEMATLLCQVEAVMNSRPISPMSNDPNDEEALTPGHFLVGGPLTDLPQPMINSRFDRLTHYQRIQHMRDTFWKRWRCDYLCLLQSKIKWTTDSPNIKIGDLVLLHDDNLPPLKWKMGRIVSVHPGRDGKVRVASIRSNGSIVRRPISKVAVLPVKEECAN